MRRLARRGGPDSRFPAADLPRQCDRDSVSRNSAVPGAIEIPVQTSGIVNDFDVPLGRLPPVDKIHERLGVRPQRLAVIVDPVLHRGGDREHHAGLF